MAPSPQEPEIIQQENQEPRPNKNKVVISGMAGVFPASRNVKELSDVLYNKINPISNENMRWNYNHPEIAHHTGKIPELDRFDAQFFKVHYRLACNMDMMSKKILEQSYQAIYDAGVSPKQLSGKKVGVYIGTCFSETEKAAFYVVQARTGFGIAGCNKSMFANRVSYWLNVKGPSLSVDEACCSSMAALEQGYLAISRGDCEAAIVGGANLCLHPQSSIHYGRIMTLSMDGKTRSFDKNASGCSKSEAVTVLFLQKAENALRVYAEVLYVKNEYVGLIRDPSGPRYGFNRDPTASAKFLRSVCKKAKISPLDIQYIEANGSAIPDADKTELESIEAVYCDGRKKPLLVGSVMSNIGYCEAAMGISSITKVLLGYHTGILAGNLHYETPRDDIPAIRDGRIRVLSDHHAFDRSYVAVNGISVTGINAQVLLHGRYKPKDPNRYKSSIPHLVTISGRQDIGVHLVMDDLKSRPVDPEQLALLHNIYRTKIPGHLGRGYIVLGTNEDNKTVTLAENAEYFDDAKRPLWFVYSGMGSQWAGMGTQLMRIPIFSAAIERCRRVLEPRGVDIVNIITSTDKSTFDNILNSFVGIAAIQIGLTDVLRELGLVPDNIIGHSVGELGCAYADGCFTAEEMILSAYSRGLVSIQTPVIRGAMAAVGYGYQIVKDMCPEEIQVACHNSSESCTISGPAEAMAKFVKELTSKGIFAKEVNCSNIAYHSRYIAEAGPGLLKYLNEVIKNPKPRSERWISTSVPQSHWNEPAAKYSSAEYHTNNLLNPVLFEESARLIPSNAVLVEIAPHGLLQAILKRSMSPSCINIPLTKRNHADNSLFLLEAIGKIFMAGYCPNVSVLYPKTEFPVSTETPILSHLVDWAHDEMWKLPFFVSADKNCAAACTFSICTHDDEHRYLRGNVIRGKTLYPFSAALVAAWDTLAMYTGAIKKKLSVEFTKVQLFAQPVLHDCRHLKLSVSLHRGSGKFEILDGQSKVATGYVMALPKKFKARKFWNGPEENKEADLNSEDVYQILHQRDYFYRDEFRSIHNINKSFTEGHLVWNNNWVTLIDGMIQIGVLMHPYDTVSKPKLIQKLVINVGEHAKCETVQVNEKTLMKVQISELLGYYSCGGVRLENIKFHKLPPMETNIATLTSLQFVPRYQTGNTDITSSIQVDLQIVAENVNKNILNAVHIKYENETHPIYDKVKDIINNVPRVTVQLKEVTNKTISREYQLLRNADLVIAKNLSTDEKMCRILYDVIQHNTFVINLEEHYNTCKVRPSALYKVVSAHNSSIMRLELARWRPLDERYETTAISFRSKTDLEMLASSRLSLPLNHKLLIITSYPINSELLDLISKWRMEAERSEIYLVAMSNDHENQCLDQLPELDLAINIYNNGVWGGEYYLPHDEIQSAEDDLTLQIGRIGDLDSLQWVETSQPKDTGISVTVHYAGINAYDVRRATVLSDVRDSETNTGLFGMEFSGVTDSGQRVMGLIPSGSVSSRVNAIPDLLWPVPDHWSLEDAATVPLAYAVAIYCLTIKTKVLPNQTILVHSGSSALGQAIISLALSMGWEVFTTVSSVRKKNFLRKLFPELPANHIGNSRDDTFADMILSTSKNKSCHLVITCVKEELKNTSLRCVGSHGTSLDLSIVPNEEMYAFEMMHINYNKNYVSVDFSSIFSKDLRTEMRTIQHLLSEGIQRGTIRPLIRVMFKSQEATRAFRLLSGGGHIGRILLRMQADDTIRAVPRIKCSPETCHLIFSDGDFLSLHWAERLVSRGAKKLHLHIPNVPAYMFYKLQIWQKQGIDVKISTDDVTTSNGVLSLLKNSINMAPVEGIYVVTTVADGKINDLLDHLDLASRKYCSSLKYFLVVSTGRSGQQMCLTRAVEHLPSTKLTLPHLANDTLTMSWRSAIDVTECALRSKSSVVQAYSRPITSTLMDEVIAITGIKPTAKMVSSTTLKDLGIQEEKLTAISTFLSDMHNIALDEDKIPFLTLQKISDMQELMTGTNFEPVKGLEVFFSYVDSDELLASTEMVSIPTLSSSTMREDELDTTQTYICCVPGLEGHRNKLYTLCDRLKLQALALQLGFDRSDESIPETASRYAKLFLKKAGLKDNFYLLGYESGVLIALEMAQIFEEHGLTGTVYCIGAAPEDFLEIVEGELSDYKTDEELQDAITKHMFTLMCGCTPADMKIDLSQYSTWREKTDICIRTLLGHVPHSAQYARSNIERAFARITQVRKYKPKFNKPMRSQIVLVRAASPYPTRNTIQQYSERPIVVYDLDTTLAHLHKDLRCPNIINRHLDREHLEAFDRKNICETYLTNAETFMQQS